MSTFFVWALTILAVGIVVLTRKRLAGEGTAGRASISPQVAVAHFVSGAVASVLWVTVLVFPESSFLGGPVMGILAVAAWWITAVCGLLLLMRWLPAKGRHAPQKARGDSWSDGPLLSVLAHGGLAVTVLVFAYFYLTASI